MKPALLWEVGWGPESPWGRLRASVIGFAFRSSVPRLAPPAKRQRRCVQGDDPRCSAPSGSGSGMATLCVALDWARTFSVCGSWKWRVREHARARPARLPGLARLSSIRGLARRHTTRLETRTKESIHMCEYASTTLVCGMKVSGGIKAPSTGHDLRREV